MSKTKKRFQILSAIFIAIIIVGTILMCVYILNPKTASAASSPITITPLNYVGTSYQLYSNLLFETDGYASESGGVIYTNATAFDIRWKKVSTSFTAMHNMGIKDCVIEIKSPSLLCNKRYTSAPEFATRLENEDVYSKKNLPDGTYTVTWSMLFESFGTDVNHSGSKQIIIEKQAPFGRFNFDNGEFLASGAIANFSWDDAPEGEAPIMATLNGNSYSRGAKMTKDGEQSIVLTDAAGNINTYTRTFYFDTKRPYIGNLSEIKSIFQITDDVAEKLNRNQNGNLEIDIGTGLPGVVFDFGDDSTASDALNISITERLYAYNLLTGKASIGSESTRRTSGVVELNSPGEYTIVVADKFGISLTLTFRLKVDTSFLPSEFVRKGDKYIVGNSKLSSIILLLGSNISNAFIQVDGYNISENSLTSQKLLSLLASKPEREKVALIRVISLCKGIETVYFESEIAIDFSDADIHKLKDIEFNDGDGNYLGTASRGIALEFGALTTELEERAVLHKKIYAYDGRNVLYIEREESVDNFLSGTVLTEYGFYTLQINDGYRVTEYTFRILEEFKSANEYMLGNEYFIAPEYNAVKLPLSFGTFTITDNANSGSKYIGKYYADKQYLFNSKLQTAYDFAFAAEYSVCVQKVANGYLYRARNQGIQVAYNDFAQLRTKIREVVKEYVSLKAFKLSDNSGIDYTRFVIVDEDLKQNGRYENVESQILGGIEYSNIMLIDKDFVFKFNVGNDAQSGNARIVVTNLETGEVFNVTNGMAFKEFSTLNGLYKVEEFCPGSDFSLVYYVYLDNVAGVADIRSSKANGKATEQTISAADTIILQVKEFNLLSVTDLIDNYCLINISGYGFSSAIPIRKGDKASLTLSFALGHKGAYEIEIYDRSKNKFSFTVYIMSVEPTATFAKAGSGDTEHVILDLQSPDKYCTIIGLKIYRNQTPTNDGELLEDSDGQTISFAVSSYVFRKGGRYKIVILDNFERKTIIELRYVKDMPSITAEGLNKERRVNKEITITIPLNCLFIIYAEKNSVFVYDVTTNAAKGERYITIKPRNEYNELIAIDDKITVKAWFESDPDSYNDFSYYLDTIAPVITLSNENGDEVNGVLFKFSLKLNFDGDIKTIDVTRNGKYFSYTKGQAITLDGSFSVVGKDIAGNIVVIEFVIDMRVDYAIEFENNKKYNSSFESGVVVAQGFLIILGEQLTITATKDGYLFEYSVMDKIMASGLYEISMQDNAGNSITLKLRVLNGISGVGIYTEDGGLLSYNSATKQSVYLNWEELSYIKSVTYKLNNSSGNDYTKGELLTKSGACTLTIIDAVGNILEIKCKIDKEINLEIKFDKSSVLENKNNYEHFLTLRFLLTLNENLELTVKRNGEVLVSYKEGVWLDTDGEYELIARDDVGNTFNKYITVIGQSLPRIDITAESGDKLSDKSITNKAFQIAWDESYFLSKVFVNLELARSGDKFSKDGKYSVEITDKLGRNVTLIVTIKSQIMYEMKFSGEFAEDVEGKEITLTRAFSFSSDETLNVAATLDGEIFTLVSYRTYTLPGLYKLTLKDDAGNIKNISIRVVGQAFLPTIFKSDDTEILSNSIINCGFYITKSKYVYSIKVNDELYEDGIILIEGKNKIEVVDVIGYKTTLYVTVDTNVRYGVTFGKRFDKLKNILTDKFLISPEEELSIKVLFNGQEIDFLNKYFVTTGIYEIELADTHGNSIKEIIEVDNRTPKVGIKNIIGEDILSSVTNQIVTISWGIDDNISEVRVNGVVIQSGAEFELDGNYEIRILSLLDKVSTQTITINHKISYELYLKNNASYEYVKDEVNYTLAIGFSLSGKQISNIECIFEGQKIVFEKGKTYISKGHYNLVITDIAGNIAYLNMVVSDKGIASGIAIGENKFYDDITINKNFIILENEFVESTNVNGEKYVGGAVLQNEGTYAIEYTDVLGRKSYQTIKIDKRVALAFEYTKIKNNDGLEVYLHTRLLLEPHENLRIELYKGGVKIDIADITKPITESGLYSINAVDDVGNILCITILVDNVAPNIQAVVNGDNTVNVKVEDETDSEIKVYFGGKIFLESIKNFVLNKNGKFKISVVDELENRAEKTVEVDMLVDVACNFLNGQSINFKPSFEFKEKINYELYFEDNILGKYTQIMDYKLNSAIVDKGNYLIKLKDERNNVAKIKFVFHGATKKLPATQYHLPTIGGLSYEVLFENQPIELLALDGILTLDKTGKYELIFKFNSLVSPEGDVEKAMEEIFYIEILNTPPKVGLSGKFKSKENLRAYGAVIIDAEDFRLFFNGAEIKSVSEVSKVGKYKVVAVDEVGNEKVFEFEIYYKLNVWSWLLIIMALIVAIVVVLMILKRKGILRIKINKKKEERKNGKI